MEFTSLLESLRKVTLGSKLKEDNASTYDGATATQPTDIKKAVQDICHQWDALKLESNFPDNVKIKLDGAIGTTNPGNAGDIKDTDQQQRADDAQVAKDMSGAVKSVSDQDKFVPKVDETKIIGKVNPQTQKAEATSNATGAKDAQQIKKDLAGGKGNLKDVSKETPPAKGVSKVK